MSENKCFNDPDSIFRNIKGMSLVDKGISIIWNPGVAAYSGIAGLYGTSVEHLVQIEKARKVFPSTEHTKLYGKSCVNRIYITPFPEAFKNHILRDQLKVVLPKEVVSASLNHALISAFYSYFNQRMPFVIDDVSYVSTTLLSDSEMADKAINKMRVKAIELGYKKKRFDEVFEDASKRRGAVLAVGIKTLSCYDYCNGERNPGKEVYIRTREGLSLEYVVGIEVIDAIERKEFFQSLS